MTPFATLVIAALITFAPPPPTAAQKAKVQELIAVLADPEARGTKSTEAGRAGGELARLGGVAAPQLIEVVLKAGSEDAYSALGSARIDANRILIKMGGRAIGPVRAVWATLNAADRWKLMEFRGERDYAAALPFVLDSVVSRDAGVQMQAIEYLAKYKEPQARRPLIALMNSAEPRLRWTVLDSLSKIGGEEVVDALIPLLAKDSWAAKGEGHLPFLGVAPSWWPDCRPEVIEHLQAMRGAKAIPALMQVLDERGAGRAHLGVVIVPLLGELGGLECLTVLREMQGNTLDTYSPTCGDPQEVKLQVEKAIKLIVKRSV